MTTRSNGPLAGFGWLQKSVDIAYRHPKPVFGGAAILMLLSVLPALLVVLMQFHSIHPGTPASPTEIVGIMAGPALLSLLIIPIYAGYLQVIGAAEQDLPARARDVLKPYRNGEAWRIIGYGLAMMLIYYALITGVIVVSSGGDIAAWYMQLMVAQANHLPPPPVPSGFGIMMALLALVGLLMLGFYAISLGQVALGGRSVFGAIGDGAVGALKNVLPLLVLALSVIVAFIVAAIVIAILAAVIILLGKLVGAWLMFLLLIPLYIAFLLLMQVVMFGVMYAIWRSTCGDDMASDAMPSITA